MARPLIGITKDVVDMTDQKVVAIGSGTPIDERPVSKFCVEALEESLAQARAGEIVGVAIAKQHHDTSGSYQIGGKCGSYSLLGALERVKRAAHELIEETELP